MPEQLPYTSGDWINSYYQYIKTNILVGNADEAAINPTRAFGGIVQAQAWPPKEQEHETFYLLVGEQDPSSLGSWSQPGYDISLQWIWTIQGTDNTQAFAANRGDRYQTYLSMCREILRASSPGSCEKLQWSVGRDSNNNLAPIGTSYMPPQYISFWKPPRFVDRFAATGGILNAAAFVTVSGFSSDLSS